MRDNFGKWFKILREENSLSQAQMADLIGFKNSQSIAMIENGTKLLPIQKWEKFCKLFKINLNKFIKDMYYVTLDFKAGPSEE